jgi:hypothetical protein
MGVQFCSVLLSSVQWHSREFSAVQSCAKGMAGAMPRVVEPSCLSVSLRILRFSAGVLASASPFGVDFVLTRHGIKGCEGSAVAAADPFSRARAVPQVGDLLHSVADRGQGSLRQLRSPREAIPASSVTVFISQPAAMTMVAGSPLRLVNGARKEVTVIDTYPTHVPLHPGHRPPAGFRAPAAE